MCVSVSNYTQVSLGQSKDSDQTGMYSSGAALQHTAAENKLKDRPEHTVPVKM